MGGLDFSLDQNVQAAKQIFQPFYEDKNLRKEKAPQISLRGFFIPSKEVKIMMREKYLD